MWKKNWNLESKWSVGISNGEDLKLPKNFNFKF